MKTYFWMLVPRRRRLRHERSLGVRWWHVITLVMVWMWFSITTVAAFVLMGRQPDVSVGFCLGVWLMPMCFGWFVWQQTRVVIAEFRRWRRHSGIK